MTAEPLFWDRVRDLFNEAAELPRAQREALLASVDGRLREEVESLLASHDEADGFLSKSVWEMIDAAEGERLAGSMIGPYRIVRCLGHGGMGTVFLAERQDEQQFSQRVAIKLVRGGGAGEEMVRRFRRERQILAALEHPNIARLLDGGTTGDGLPYLVMEYVDGTPIDDYCAAHCTLEQKMRLFLQLCDAVAYAHRNLVIHRDIKPANVLVADGIPKLLDFGIAKLESPDSRAMAPATRLMTPEYASPEQLLGHAVSTSTDVYSLGVLLYQLLTGKQPFGATRTASSEAPRPSMIDRALRGDLDTIVLTAMEVDPARRYASVEKLAEDVRRYLSGHPIAARPATFGYRAIKFVRRNTLAVAAGTAILIVTIVAFAATLHQKRIAERRFEQVRTLARSVVFELHDAIATLPGSTPARELLVRRALVYLDNLAAEAEDNAPLLMELAGAYLKIGDVQGLPYQPNIGDTDGALASYRKALTIAELVRRDEPENVDALTLLADAHDRVGLVQQRALLWEVAIVEHEAARAIRESLPQTPKRDLALARTWTAIGDCRYIGNRKIPQRLKLGTARQAYESALASLRVLPRDPQLRREGLRELGRAHQRLGGYFSGIMERDFQRAIQHHQAALRALEERSSLAPGDAVARRNYADQFVMKATAHNLARDGAGALASADRGLEMLRAIAEADPKNSEAQHDLAFAYGERGRALHILGRHDEAVRAFDAAIVIHERLIAADPSNNEERRDLSRIQGMRKASAQLRNTS
jgi:eukaryotic-like serine/threonine-protein kinase